MQDSMCVIAAITLITAVVLEIKNIYIYTAHPNDKDILMKNARNIKKMQNARIQNMLQIKYNEIK